MPMPDLLTALAMGRCLPSIKICTGNLSTQTMNQYFPNHTVITKRQWDIQECYVSILNGETDVFVNSLPVLPSSADFPPFLPFPPGTLQVPGEPTFQPAVDLKIVAGTPYWVREDDVECGPVAGPPGPPAPPGTFYECTKD